MYMDSSQPQKIKLALLGSEKRADLTSKFFVDHFDPASPAGVVAVIPVAPKTRGGPHERHQRHE